MVIHVPNLPTFFTVTFGLSDLLSWLVVGLLAGFFASIIVRGRGYGCFLDIVIGLVGAFIGGFIASFLGIRGTYHFWGSLLIAFLGACILVAILKAFSAGGRGSYRDRY
jgi:uncharacterized membrane protein YeaQ/YmgE (transglycosylase-associated protein family)